MFLVRAYVLQKGHQFVMNTVVRRVSDAVENHVPLGGVRSLQIVLGLLTWREQLHFARCSTAAQAGTRALFGGEHAPMECNANQLEHVVKSRVCRFVRHIRVKCIDSDGALTLNEAGIEVLRDLPLLRFITLLDLDTPDSELLVLLTRRPSPELLQSVRIERCHSLNSQATECFRRLPALHTLALNECTLHDETMLEGLEDFPHLETLALNFTPGDHFHSGSLRPIAKTKHLRRLHLHTLCASQGFISTTMVKELWTSPVFTQHLECLSLCYVQLSSKDCPLFSGLVVLKALELSWCSPLAIIVPIISRLPLLESLLLGDDNLPLIERLLSADLIRAPKLQHIEVYGFVGVGEERFREWRETVRRAQTKYHTLELRYLGDRREYAMKKSTEFGSWAK